VWQDKVSDSVLEQLKFKAESESEMSFLEKELLPKHLPSLLHPHQYPQNDLVEADRPI
jgi:hypothetical protein